MVYKISATFHWLVVLASVVAVSLAVWSVLVTDAPSLVASVVVAFRSAVPSVVSVVTSVALALVVSASVELVTSVVSSVELAVSVFVVTVASSAAGAATPESDPPETGAVTPLKFSLCVGGAAL